MPRIFFHQEAKGGNIMDERVTDLGGFNKLVKGRDGYFLANENDMYIGRALIKYGEFSHLEFNLFKQIIREGAVVADIGANIGVHTVGIAKHVGEQGRILAFEPQPVIFQALCANIALNGLINVDCFNMGLGEKEAQIKVPFYRYDQEGNFGGVSLDVNAEAGSPVDVKIFDDFFPYPRLDFMKIDVEGMEEGVIKGAQKTIGQFKPVLYVENDRPDKSEALIKRILDLDYRLWWHTPPLFNPENFFGDKENLYPNVVSLNMLGIHKDVPANLDNFTEITEPTVHPVLEAALKKQQQKKG